MLSCSIFARRVLLMKYGEEEREEVGRVDERWRVRGFEKADQVGHDAVRLFVVVASLPFPFPFPFHSKLQLQDLSSTP